jgi:Domain of unknown function (DUF4833)
VALLAFALPAPGEDAGSAGDACPTHLFVIARSKNANIVAYDANRVPAGDFVASTPVVVYWLLNGENGKREELNLVERQRAYGFDVTPGDSPLTYNMVFKADRKRRFNVRILDGCPVVTGSIGGEQGVLRRMFVQSKEDSMTPKVEYVELFGENAADRRPLYEKFVPGK